MGAETGIAWTDHTANFWMGCQRVSPGCEHCYAETLVTNRMGLRVWGPTSTTERKRTASAWKDVPRWDRAACRDGVRRKLFVSSLADIFEDHPQVAPWRAEALALLERCTNLDVQLLTKRPENILAMVPESWRTAWPAHVWIGTTVEDQQRAVERIPHLLRVPAAVRFLSCEPLLSPVMLDLRERYSPMEWSCDGGCLDADDHIGNDSAMRCRKCHTPNGGTPQPGISWVIVGGESGPGARPFDIAWARSILRQCREAGVPCFVKQMGAVTRCEPADIVGRALGREVDLIERGYETRWELLLRNRAGADPAEWPADLRVQEFPEVSR